LLVALVAPLAATLIQLGISRSREFLADETGANISGDPEALARALVKLEQASALVPVEAVPATASLFIVNPLGSLQAVSKWFSTHPQTHERVERLLAMTRSQRRAGHEPYPGRLVREW
jgi:heat shock protein HtpX